jgi:hypothetical protein
MRVNVRGLFGNRLPKSTDEVGAKRIILARTVLPFENDFRTSEQLENRVNSAWRKAAIALAGREAGGYVQ